MLLIAKTPLPPVDEPKTLEAVVAVFPKAAGPPKTEFCVVEAPLKMEPELLVAAPPNTLDDPLLLALANIAPKGEAVPGAAVATDPPNGEPVAGAPVVANPPKGEPAAGTAVVTDPPNGEPIAGAADAAAPPKTD